MNHLTEESPLKILPRKLLSSKKFLSQQTFWTSYSTLSGASAKSESSNKTEIDHKFTVYCLTCLIRLFYLICFNSVLLPFLSLRVTHVACTENQRQIRFSDPRQALHTNEPHRMDRYPAISHASGYSCAYYEWYSLNTIQSTLRFL